MFIFFFLIMILYVVACVYVGISFVKIYKSKLWRIISGVCFGALSSLFFLQRAIGNLVSEEVNSIIYVISTTWLVLIMYGVMLLLLLDLARLISRLRYKEKRPRNRQQIIGVGTLLIIILGVGYHNATNTRTVRYSFKSPQLAAGDTLRVAIASDLHLGYGLGQKDMARLTQIVNATHADLFILAGDQLDGDLKPVISGDLGRPLDSINCKYGTYAVLGNHEMMAGGQAAADYLGSLRLTLLRDSAASIGQNIRIIGRNEMSHHATALQRKTLGELTADTCFNIVVDHQPGSISESVAMGADLHISGHTHAGQVWPMRFFTSRIFDVDYGFCKMEDTHVVVTSGFGTWGPRMRIGSQSEVVIVEIIGTK